jgi:glutamate racemase
MTNTKHSIQKIGVYDSGLGGLFVLSKIYEHFPGYDYVFIGDEKNLPYGSKSIEELFTYARSCLDFLFTKEKCDVVIIACNTLSATVYETLQKEYAKTHRDQLLIDVITPTIDALSEASSFVVFGTPRTVDSHIYKNEVSKKFSKAEIQECATPMLASLIEAKEDTTSYISSFKGQISNHSAVGILACTHYGLVENTFKEVFPNFSTIIKQDVILLDLMRFILNPKKEHGSISVYVTKTNPIFDTYTKEWFNSSVSLVEL